MTAPNPVLALLGDTLRKPDGTTVASSDALKKDVLGLYFSAHWCPPCRGFTPQLATKYKALKDAGKSLEMVFVSSDRDAKSFDDYHGEQPWLALPFDKRTEKGELSNMFGVRGIPTLVFVDAKTGKTITTEGRPGVSSATFVEDFPYHPKPVNDLASTTSGINDQASIVVLMERADASTQKALTAALTEIALAEMKTDDPNAVKCFFTATGGGPAPKIRSMCGLPALPASHPHPLSKKDSGGGWGCDGCGGSGAGKERFRCSEGCDFDLCGACHDAAAKANPLDSALSKPTMVILDLKDSGAFYPPSNPSAEPTAESIRAFIADFKAKKLVKGKN